MKTAVYGKLVVIVCTIIGILGIGMREYYSYLVTVPVPATTQVERVYPVLNDWIIFPIFACFCVGMFAGAPWLLSWYLNWIERKE